MKKKGSNHTTPITKTKQKIQERRKEESNEREKKRKTDKKKKEKKDFSDNNINAYTIMLPMLFIS